MFNKRFLFLMSLLKIQFSLCPFNYYYYKHPNVETKYIQDEYGNVIKCTKKKHDEDFLTTTTITKEIIATPSFFPQETRETYLFKYNEDTFMGIIAFTASFYISIGLAIYFCNSIKTIPYREKYNINDYVLNIIFTKKEKILQAASFVLKRYDNIIQIYKKITQNDFDHENKRIIINDFNTLIVIIRSIIIDSITNNSLPFDKNSIIIKKTKKEYIEKKIIEINIDQLDSIIITELLNNEYLLE